MEDKTAAGTNNNAAAASNEAFRVVLASVTNLLYPVDIDLIHYLFSKYGEIEKIVTFSKTPTMYQALIQFQNADQARNALVHLHSRNIYDGCNTLQIQPSRLNELIVKNNTQKSWDYTVQSGGPSGTAGQGGGGVGDMPPQQGAGGGGGGHHHHQSSPGGVGVNSNANNSLHSNSGANMLGNNGRSLGGGHNNANPSHPHHGPYGGHHPPHMNAGAGGAVAGMQPPPPGHHGAGMGHPPHHPNAGRLPGAAGGPLAGAHHPYHHHHASNLLHLVDKLPRELREINLETTNPTQTPVIIVYNLPANITVQMLFNLFSLYGSVLRVKILREKSDTALIQYSDPLYATIACNYIQGANVLGQCLQVGFSKNMEVKLPPPNQNKEGNTEEEKRTVAFSIKDQRYGGDDVEKYVKGSCRPTRTIFVANLDEHTTEEEVTKLFSEHGAVSKFTFKAPKNESAKTQMAMMEMASEAEAVAAVMFLHNHEIHGRSMKVAFSKTVL